LQAYRQIARRTDSLQQTAQCGDKNDRRLKSYVGAQIDTAAMPASRRIHSKPAAAYLSAPGIALLSAVQKRGHPVTRDHQAIMSPHWTFSFILPVPLQLTSASLYVFGDNDISKDQRCGLVFDVWYRDRLEKYARLVSSRSS